VEHDWQLRVDRAIDWARGWLGSTEYTTRCLAFVEDAYERSGDVEVFGGDFAHESAELYGARHRTGTPPAGAFVFYDTTGELAGIRQNWGHVGLCVGDGRVVHAWDRVRIDHHLEIPGLSSPPGWDAPARAGWAPVERVFQGARAKDWTAEGEPAEAARRMMAARWSCKPPSGA
jgi:cell wall-associated NlpC family hydrolase